MYGVSFVLTGEMQDHAITALKKALQKYEAKEQKAKSKDRKSKSTKADLQFPVGRVIRIMKTRNVANRIGVSAGIAMAAVLEYCVNELLEVVCARVLEEAKVTTITPRHILKSIHDDREMHALFKNATIVSGGVIEKIHPALLPKKSSKSQK